MQCVWYLNSQISSVHATLNYVFVLFHRVVHKIWRTLGIQILHKCCVFQPANACLRMVENDQKHLKMSKKVPFSSCTREALDEKRRKKFVGQRLGVTPKSWLTPKCWLLIWNFAVFCSFCYMSVSCAWRKMFWKNFFNDFRMFLIVFGHANACASMCSLVEIHNTQAQYLNSEMLPGCPIVQF